MDAFLPPIPGLTRVDRNQTVHVVRIDLGTTNSTIPGALGAGWVRSAVRG